MTALVGQHRGSRSQRQRDGESRRGIARHDLATMGADRARGDREPETHAGVTGGARCVDAVERLEDLLERLLGHSGTTVADLDLGAPRRGGAPQFDFDGAARRCMAQRVAQHVLDGRTEPVGVGVDLQVFRAARDELAAGGLGFETCVGDQRLQQRGEIERLEPQRGGSRLEPRDVEDGADQSVETGDFGLESPKLRRDVRTRLLGESDREPHPCERRTQFV